MQKFAFDVCDSGFCIQLPEAFLAQRLWVGHNITAPVNPFYKKSEELSDDHISISALPVIQRVYRTIYA
jgi:hypothetical protein